jgi:transposase-like protein
MEEKLYTDMSASSLEEGLEETLTLIRVNAPNEIRKSLGCTNVIENMNGLIRKTTQRVRRWSNEEMIMRWVSSGIMESEKSFRQVKGYRSIQILLDRISNMSKIIITKVA